ncbi:SDR family NAD(P)-dependent oxidoreductase [Amycolatopsis sp. NPDC021455]|uniref:SDR family NAD(P)-dependent oxidoreductase n=1 Tax=Amycolatopsis sp. NPDC021455 TaxID=3154901 RepID=UPI0033F63072
MDLRLTGKRVLVTGGSRGIGRISSLAFAEAGAQVAFCYRQDEDAAGSLAKELAELGAAPVAVRADVTDREDVDRLLARCQEAFGGLDVLVNNAGVDGSSTIEDLEPDEWQRVLDVNIGAAYRVTRAALPLLGEGASVINIGASSGLRGRPLAPHHTAAKAAVIGLTRSLAKELGRKGIRVNNLAPGVIETEQGTPFPPQAIAHLTAMTSLGRLGRPAEVAGAALFLASDLAAYVTGVTLNVDGGM